MFDELKEKMKSKGKEQITDNEAYEMIKEWSDILEVRLKDDDYQAMADEIWMAVKKERLSFDPESEIFTYTLKKPIEKKDGSGNISMLKIHESDMKSKEGLSRYKEEMDKVAAMFKAHCTDVEGNTIEHGFLKRIKDRDVNIISAVILGFFVQAVPGKV